MKRICIVLVFALMCGCYTQENPTAENPQIPVRTDQDKNVSESKVAPKLQTAMQAAAPFFKVMGKPGKMDWLASNPEPGQTFEEYLKSAPMIPTAQRKTIYIQPLGKFSPAQTKVLSLTAEYMRAFYNLPVVLQPEKVLPKPPEKYIRKNPWSKQEQVLVNYFLDDLLPGMMPKDAAAFISFTDSDLFPEEKWSFVFGMASLQKRVGVWSLYRLGNPEKSENDYKLFLRRTLKIAMHETGHMFSMKHCTKYECLMSGTNSVEETDRRPLDNCPECMAKIAWAMKYEPRDRYGKLSEFWRRNGDLSEANLFSRKAAAVAGICVFCN